MLKNSTRKFSSIGSTLEKASLKHVTKISDLSHLEITSIINAGVTIKKNKSEYSTSLKDRTLLMLFEKPSLRTRVSFETGMTQMGGHAIFYSIADSPLGKKESISDTGKVLSRYCDAIMARVNSKNDILSLAEHSTIPVINGLDDWAHPCQMLCDFMTIYEKKIGIGSELNKYDNFNQLKFAYIGDCENNVTYDLMRICSILGVEMRVVGPVNKKGFEVNSDVLKECEELSNGSNGTVPIVTDDWKEGLSDVDVIYTDSFMSYGIPDSELKYRMDCLMPYQVNDEKLNYAKGDSIFMNCLPAMRGMEQTEDVIDGPQSVVFDQAENRLHAQKALLLYLINGHLNPI